MSRSWLFACCGLLLCSGLAFAEPWTGDPSPHSQAHLIVVRPQDLQGAKDGVQREPLAGASFQGEVARVKSTATSTMRVREAGTYTLWVRLAVDPKRPQPVQFRVLRDKEVLLEGTAGQETTEAEAGGSGGVSGVCCCRENHRGGGEIRQGGGRE